MTPEHATIAALLNAVERLAPGVDLSDWLLTSLVAAGDLGVTAETLEGMRPGAPSLLWVTVIGA